MRVGFEDIEQLLNADKASQNEINSVKRVFHSQIFKNLMMIEYGYILTVHDEKNKSKDRLLSETGHIEDLSVLDVYDLTDFLYSNTLTYKQAASITPQQMSNLDESFKDQIQEVLITLSSGNEDYIRYSLSQIVQTGFPYREVKGDQYFERKNGRLTVTMSAPNSIGLPSGILPRLFFVHLCSEIVKNKTRVITLGPSLKRFVIDDMGRTYSTGKKSGSKYRWPKIIASVLATSFTITEELKLDDKHSGLKLENVTIADSAKLWWHDDYDDSVGAEIKISEHFYEALTNHATPLDVRALKDLSALTSPLAFDLYCWLTFRYWKMEQFNTSIVRISWRQLQAQMGTNIATVRNFKIECRKALQQVAKVYPDANFNADQDDVLILTTSLPHVKPQIGVKQKDFFEVEDKPESKV